MKALITAGGTSEPIDDVRVVTNLSTGRFGAAIANALVERGVEVTVLASRNLAGHSEWLDERVAVVPFGSFSDLARELDTQLTSPPDLLFMAAAVSDYSPVATDGKIRSTKDELVIRMVRNPKLLPALRDKCGPDTYLVDFKLLSGVSERELIDTAVGQLKKGRLDLTVANDLATFAPGLHPVVLVRPDGSTRAHRGSKQQAAQFLADFVLSETQKSSPDTPDSNQSWLTDVPSPLDLTPTASQLAEHLPSLQAVFRMPTLALPTLELPPTVAPGSPVEAPTILRALAQQHGRTWDGQTFTVGSKDHVLIGASDVDHLTQRWNALTRLHDAHLTKLQHPSMPRRPVFVGGEIVAVLAECSVANHAAVTLFLDPAYKARGIGDRLVRRLGEGQRVVALHDDCRTDDLYQTRGFSLLDREGPLTVWRPPAMRDDVVECASICLINRRAQTVLLGRRKVDDLGDLWSFPGGKREAGESLRECAARELFEETGLRLPLAEAIAETTIVVGTSEKAWRIHNFAFPVPFAHEPQETDEMNARWVHRDDLDSSISLVSGTKTVLRRVFGTLS